MKITNRKAFHDYIVVEEFIAGMQLTGSEVKSLKVGEANLIDSFCYTTQLSEIFVKGIFISKNKNSSYNNHEEKRDRKLLLTKKEIKKIIDEVKCNRGLTIIPLEIFEIRGKFKLKICIAKGKKTYDKRAHLKERDLKMELKKELNYKN